MLYCDIENDRVNLRVYDSNFSDVQLVGTTLPVAPVGTVVQKLVFDAPNGLHALVFYGQFSGQVEKGSGRTRHLEHVSKTTTYLELFWSDDGKAVAKSASEMSTGDLARFNSFIQSSADILVMDTSNKVAYVWSMGKIKPVDPDWTYKSVSIGAMLAYITRLISLEELGELAGSEQKARGELAYLRNSVQSYELEVSELAGRLTDASYRAEAMLAYEESVEARVERMQKTLTDLESFRYWFVFWVKGWLGPCIKWTAMHMQFWADRQRARLKEREARWEARRQAQLKEREARRTK